MNEDTCFGTYQEHICEFLLIRPLENKECQECKEICLRRENDN